MTAAIAQFINTCVKPMEHPVRAWSGGVKCQFDVHRWMKGNNLLGDSLHGLFLETLDSLMFVKQFNRIKARWKESKDPIADKMLYRMDQIRLPLYIALGAVTVLNGLYYVKRAHEVRYLSTLATAAHLHIPLIKAVINTLLSAGEYTHSTKEQVAFTAGYVSYLARNNAPLPKQAIQLMNLFALVRSAVLLTVGDRVEKIATTTFFAYNFFIVPRLLSESQPT